MEQRPEHAMRAPAGEAAARSGAVLGISPRSVPHVPDAVAAPPDEQATLLGSLAPHVEPSAGRRPESFASGAPGHLPHGMAQPPAPPGPGQAPEPPSPSPAPPQPPLPAVAALPENASDAAPLWPNPAGRQPLPGHPPASPAHLPSHVPWHAARSWGATSITIEANTAAGASYLFWWLSGLLVYFNERQNRFVRFHAMQSILLTGALTVFAVLAWIVSALCGDVAQYARDPLIRHLFGTLGWGILIMAGVGVLFVWVPAMVAAWTGNYLRLPIVGQYAERYAAPPIEPAEPPLY